MKTKYTITAWLIFLFSLGCSAQQLSERIKNTTVTIYNSSKSKLNFKLGRTNGNLKTYSIEANEKWISPHFTNRSKPLFIIQTKKQNATYKLRVNRIYKIYWNNKKKIWDIVKIKKLE